MSLNRYRPHVYVVPEDDANRQLANGFRTGVIGRLKVLPEAGGWLSVLDRFQSQHISAMEATPQRLLVLLIDFDGQQDRILTVQRIVPGHLTERVFVLGVLTNPEELRRELGSYETIGLALARDCRDGTDITWSHALLRHNANEVARLRDRIRPILFEGS